MSSAANRFEDIAIGIANPVPDNAPQPAVKAEQDVKPAEPIAPVSPTSNIDQAQQWIDLKQTELAFKASAMATKSVASAAQELMDVLR
ncbi:hypothetical protein C0081_11565 [Cohaesibacter celericrescens]|uniref:Uncharacterized protein n=2 Tax=Cohaesibacter celericrescens TaxID=2067669 RepID=A0A2N5XQD5_9HYPH|nr:hypothetical protein C0081_11565 [Cohaesibacter celericrescens]